jgi:hypothetical protein
MIYSAYMVVIWLARAEQENSNPTKNERSENCFHDTKSN